MKNCHVGTDPLEVNHHRVFSEKSVRDYKDINSFIISKICRSEIESCVHNIRLVQHRYGCHNRPEVPE